MDRTSQLQDAIDQVTPPPLPGPKWVVNVKGPDGGPIPQRAVLHP